MAKRRNANDVTIAHDIEMQSMRGRVADLQTQYRHVCAQLKEADERLESILGIKRKVDGVAPKIIVPTSGKSGESVAFMVASDWHLEERVDPRTVDGLNEYSPTISEDRVKKFFANSLNLVEMCRAKSRIDTGVLLLLGDHITGMIHDDLAESNYMSPTEAVLAALRLARGGINLLLKHGGFKKLLVVCNFGNHGRSTKKMRVSTAAKHSYEWMMYHLLAEGYAKDNRVRFTIADGYFAFLEVFGKVIRTHHGNGIQYQGGVGGLTIPLNKAIAQWNKARKADLDVLGHWHTMIRQRDAVVNGSVIGYNAYSITIKASFEPPQQTFFLMHPRYGKTIEAPVVLE